MILGIAADLSAPPSTPTTFRELTMWVKYNRRYDVLAYAERDMLSAYAQWFRRYGLFDYVDDLIARDEVDDFAVHIEGGNDARLTIHNLHLVIALL